ncbi:MAG TPA: hypothetical protein VMD29_12730 [Terracidiphilus sp.]|nr:hypothetical protein [Terracidiphilus sp.]
MSNPAQVTILAEDRRQARLVRAYIRKRLPVYPQKAIKDIPMASGRGSGLQWVLDRYAIEVKAHLTRRARKWLVVVIDADRDTLQERLDALKHRLETAEDDRLRRCSAEDEQIARLIPKWSVETWILCLNGSAVDEQTAYKSRNHDWDRLTRPAAEALHNWATDPHGAPAGCVPCLKHGIEELKRLVR